MTVTVVVVPVSTTVQVRVSGLSDDAEEDSTGLVSLDSSDLELVSEGGVPQTVGMRFNGIAVPRGATVLDAWIQFQADETGSTTTSLTIQGEAADNATTFGVVTGNVSTRPRTTAAVTWTPVPWTTVDVAGPDQRTPNIKSVIQEIVNRPGWSIGGSLAIIVTGTGKRTAEAYDGVPAAAPLLHVAFTNLNQTLSPDIDVTPGSHDYGAVSVGANAVRTFSIRNLGNADLQVNTTDLTGAQFSEFAVVQGGAPFTVAPGGIHNLDVRFSPTSVDSKTAILHVTSTDPDENPVDVALSGTGTAAPDIELAPNSYAYGSVPVGGNVVKTFAVRNLGNSNLLVTSTSFVGGQSGEFSVTSGAAPFTVPPGDSHNIDVRFVPTSVGAKSTTLRFSSNDPDENPLNVTLSGTGSGPDIDVTPRPYNFGSVTLGATAVRTFAIRNTGNTDLQVTGTDLTGGQVGEFAITQGAAPFTVVPGGTRNLDIRFSPISLGAKTTTLRVTSTDPDENPFNVVLSGTGVQADIAVTPTSHDYGNQAVGTNVTKAFVVSNTGTGNLVVGQSTLSGTNANNFAFVSGQAGFTIAPGSTGSIEVRFSPSTNGAKTATLTIPSNDPDENPFLIPLNGFGITMPTFQEMRQGGSGNASSVTTSAPMAAVAGHLYLAAVSTRPRVAVNTVSGLSLTWTRVASQCGGRNETGVELWWAQGPASAGPVTATLMSSVNNAVIAVARYSGVATTNPVGLLVAGNTRGVNGACSGGVNTATYSFGVTTTSSQALVFGAVALRTRTHTAGSGYTERAEVAHGKGQEKAGVAFEDRPVSTPTSLLLNGTLNGTADWAVIGIELRPQ
jgi:hypothetical protein